MKSIEENLKLLKNFIDKVELLRRHQKAWFKDKGKDDLRASMAFEAEVDKLMDTVKASIPELQLAVGGETFRVEHFPPDENIGAAKPYPEPGGVNVVEEPWKETFDDLPF